MGKLTNRLRYAANLSHAFGGLDISGMLLQAANTIERLEKMHSEREEK